MISRERLNMPEISNISLNANYAATTKPQQTNKTINKPKPVPSICITCNKPYNKRASDNLLTNIPTITNFDYQDKCLNCIKEASRSIKATKYPNLKKLRKIQNIMNLAYQSSYNKWKAASNEYQALDYQENIIKHHLTKPSASQTKATTKKTKTAKQIGQATALKILESLTEEQRSAILANIAKQ